MGRILVIDDENNIRMMIRLALQHVGHTVERAADGPEGLEKFGDGSGWDLVLLDQRMPGMEGLAVLKEMRDRDPYSKVIMITAFGTIDLAVDAMKAGATDFLRKPFSANTLRGAVEMTLQGRPKLSPLGIAPEGISFGLMTVNGYHILSQSDASHTEKGDIIHSFSVSGPDGKAWQCEVILPVYVIELVRAYADQEDLPGGDRFWHALCEEVVANYIWQHADTPPEGVIRVNEMTTGLKRWVSAALSAGKG
ncbi:MAG: response regulator [Armatimonadetes bacterium]|nr:response regulator [Armatimonadota bacterium]